MISVIDASALDATFLLALRLLAWGNIGVAAAVLAGVVLWQVCCGFESRNCGK